MAVVAQILNGTNLCRDAGFMAPVSSIVEKGVRKNYLNDLAVTTNQVATGMCFVEVTRTAVTPNEIFLIPIWVTANVTVDTSGNGWIIVRVDKDKVNDGSANSTDGTGIATVEKVTSLPVDDDYLILATLSGGAITDARTWARISEDILQDALYYDEDAQASDAYVITVSGFKGYVDGQEYTFKANTANTGAATLQVVGGAAKSIRKNANTVLDNNDIKVNQIVVVRYNADNDWFEMISQLGNPGLSSSIYPTGSVHAWVTNSAPSGYLLCDGSAVSRTTYADLFAVIGTTFGAGDGSTTFNLPNLKGRTIVGRDAAQTEFDTLGETGGAKTHTLTAAESGVPAHAHPFQFATGSGSGVSGIFTATGGGTTLSNAGGPSPAGASVINNTSAPASSAHNNLQPYIALNYIIKI